MVLWLWKRMSSFSGDFAKGFRDEMLQMIQKEKKVDCVCVNKCGKILPGGEPKWREEDFHCTILPTLPLLKVSNVHVVGWGHWRTEREAEFTGSSWLTELEKKKNSWLTKSQGGQNRKKGLQGSSFWGLAEPHPPHLPVNFCTSSKPRGENPTGPAQLLGLHLCLPVLSDHREEGTSQRKSGGYHLGMKEENTNVLSTWPQEFLNLNSCCFPHEKRTDHYSLDPSYKQSIGKGFILLSWIQLALASVIVIWLAQSQSGASPGSHHHGQGFEVI